MTLTFRSTLFFAALFLSLNACAIQQQAPSTSRQSAPVAATPVEPALVEPMPKPPSRAAEKLANLPRVTMLPPERAMRDGLAGPDAPGPDRLIGLAAADIRKMLGIPDFKRHDPPAQIWQYKKNGCLLDLFLYQDEGQYRVTHVEARGYSVKEISGTECLLEALAR